MKITPDSTVEDFTAHFLLRGRFMWRDVPRLDNIRNFGNIISMILYRQPPFQVELLIVPHQHSSFTTHRHPDVDTVEFGLCGDSVFIKNGKPGHTDAQMASWLAGDYDTPLIRLTPNDWHSGYGNTPYSFLSIQKWLHDVEPTSVGLNWDGDTSSTEQEQLIHINEEDIFYTNLTKKIHEMSTVVKWHMTV